MHFVVSHQQVTEHTVVTYFKSPNAENVTIKSFRSLSESLRHDACANFAHVKGILIGL